MGKLDRRMKTRLPAHNESVNDSKEAPMNAKKKLPVHSIRHLCELAHMADEPASTDVLGSYTGTGQNADPPVQDADDL